MSVHVILDEEEAQSLLQLITAQVVDQVELEAKTVAQIREWRKCMERGSSVLLEFAVALNEHLGNTMDDELKRTIRRRDYYRTT